MGAKPRQRPERLAEKLLQIRTALGLSQSELLRRLGAEEAHAYQRLSEWESGEREPSLPLLLRYARAANISTDALIDDELDLPQALPSPTKHEGIRRKSTPRTRPKRSR